MRTSKQRELILKTLAENPIHPTAEQLYAWVKLKAPTISLATVYRNLNLLAENGVIKKISGLDGMAHFDHHTHNHYHFICQKCNKVYDVPYDVAPDLADKVFSQTGLIIENYDISFKGVCPECHKKECN